LGFSLFLIILFPPLLYSFRKINTKNVTLRNIESLLYTSKYLKTLVIEEIKITENEEDPNSTNLLMIAQFNF
jgi:hypothetical protein